MLAADGFAEAFIGVGYRCGQTEVAVYSIPLAVDILVREGMKPEEAMEYLEFNTLGAWVGDETPLWVSPMSMKEYLEVLAEAGELINEDYYSCESTHNQKEPEDGGEEAGPDGKDLPEQ